MGGGCGDVPENNARTNEAKMIQPIFDHLFDTEEGYLIYSLSTDQ